MAIVDGWPGAHHLLDFFRRTPEPAEPFPADLVEAAAPPSPSPFPAPNAFSISACACVDIPSPMAARSLAAWSCQVLPAPRVAPLRMLER